MPPMTLGRAISVLRSAVVNARIYPKGSQMIETSLKGAHDALAACLQETPQILISDIQGKLCINGKEASEARDFRTFLVQHEIQSLKLLQGVEMSEIVSLVDGLGKRKGQYDDKKNLSEWLAAQGVTHLQVEEVEYVALQKGEVVVQQITQLMDQAAGDTTALINSIDESFRLMDQLPDDQTRKDVQKQMANHLSGLPPFQLKELIDSQLPEKAENAGFKEAVIQALSQEKLEETLEEVHKWYKQIKQETASEFEVVEKLNDLKSFLGKVLHSPASKTVPFALYEELLNVGLLDEMPAGVEKGQYSSLLAQVEQWLNQTSVSLLDPPVRQKFPDVLKALCAMSLDEFLQKLTEKVLENLQNPTPLVRETTVKTLRVFEEILATNRKEKPFFAIVSTLHRMADLESAPDVYGEIVQALETAAMELLVNWRFEESAILLGTLRRHSREESPIGQKKKELAAKALREFAARELDVICADLNSLLSDRQNGAYRVLAELGGEAVAPLVEAVKRSLDPRSRQAAIQTLQRLGPEIKGPLLNEIHLGMSSEVLIKLFSLLTEFVDASMVPALVPLLQHPDAPVRRHIAQLLAKIRDPHSLTLLVQLLDDADPEIQTDAVRLLGELRVKTAVAEFTKRLFSVAPPVQEQLCIWLGNFRDAQAVPDLIKLLQSKKSFWKRANGIPDSVRVRAAWALGQLLPDPGAKKALTQALKDSNTTVQRAAQSALTKVAAPTK